MFKRIILIVLDGLGIGHAPDSTFFGDSGANTLGNIEKEFPIECSFLKSIGLGQISDIFSFNRLICGIYGRLSEISAGKDTMSGHWELMGHPIKESFPTFSKAFPQELMDRFTRETGYGYLGNEVASGTEIIQRLGPLHVKQKKPIIYTSADSVFQIAAHESILPLEELYRICEITRKKVCIGKYNLGRVIARPFIGTVGSFIRTANRHDYIRMPDYTMYHEIIKDAGYRVIGVGKIGDIYAHRGLSDSYSTISNEHGMMIIAQLLRDKEFERGLIMANLLDFDSLYGHRRDIIGYGHAVERFDYQLKALCELLHEEDLLLLTADHGNDPTWEGTDHTRERVPLLGDYKGLNTSINIGDRDTFADVGQTILENFNCSLGIYGTSFLKNILESKES